MFLVVVQPLLNQDLQLACQSAGVSALTHFTSALAGFHRLAGNAR